MAIVDFLAPNFPENLVQKIIFKNWVKKTGDSITSGEILCHISNGQKTAPLKTSVSGVLIELLADDDSILTPKQLLARINTAAATRTEETKDTAAPCRPADNQPPTPEIKTELERPSIDCQAEAAKPVIPAPDVLTKEDDSKNTPPDTTDTFTARSAEKINLLSNKIETLANSIEASHRSRAAGQLEILQTLKNFAAQKTDEINSSVKEIRDRFDFLDDQLKTMSSQFATTIEAIHSAQVKTLEEISKISSANGAEEGRFSAELAELRKMLAALQKPHTAELAPQTLHPQQESNPEVTDMLSFLSWLGLQNSVPFSSLRNRLLPLDLLPNAVIDEINGRALSLTGEPALEQDGDNVIVQGQVLVRVMGAWQGNG